jgi:hypothetical protein
MGQVDRSIRSGATNRPIQSVTSFAFSRVLTLPRVLPRLGHLGPSTDSTFHAGVGEPSTPTEISGTPASVREFIVPFGAADTPHRHRR